LRKSYYQIFLNIKIPPIRVAIRIVPPNPLISKFSRLDPKEIKTAPTIIHENMMIIFAIIVVVSLLIFNLHSILNYS